MARTMRTRDWHGLQLSIRAANVLMNAEIGSPIEAANLGFHGLLRLPNMGMKSGSEVWELVGPMAVPLARCPCCGSFVPAPAT